jgi:glutamate synthase domain-containing protein 2
MAAILVGVLGWLWRPLLWLYLPLAGVVSVGLWDLYFSTNTILRNFPFLGHFRYLSLRVSPEIHQYFIESSTEGKPFSKLQRSIVNKRADKRLETHPFGTEQDVYGEHSEWVLHSIYPSDGQTEAPRVRVGGPRCLQPYDAAVLNISAMSFGSLSAAAIRALNYGAKAGGFYHNTGEGGLSPHHEVAGADLVWEIGSGYFGCRKENGDFDKHQFQKTATQPAVKMVEIKLSQGAKPGHGGVLPARKNTPEIAAIRGVQAYTKVVSPARHKAFSDARSLLAFVEQLRELSGGKPVGFKLCLGIAQEFIDICQAMVDTEITPDFITVDGSEGGTGAAPPEFSDSAGMPLEEALAFVSDTLRGFGLADTIRVIAGGKIITGFDLVKAFALGADICNSARGMMFALGCIQALKCDTDECPTAITTQAPHLTRGLVVEAKARRVTNYQEETVKAALEILAGMGLQRFDELQRHHIQKRTREGSVKTLEDLHPAIDRRSHRR